MPDNQPPLPRFIIRDNNAGPILYWRVQDDDLEFRDHYIGPLPYELSEMRWAIEHSHPADRVAQPKPQSEVGMREALHNCLAVLEKLKSGYGTAVAQVCWQPISQAKAALSRQAPVPATNGGKAHE